MKRASTLLSHSIPGLWSSVGVGPKQAFAHQWMPDFVHQIHGKKLPQGGFAAGSPSAQAARDFETSLGGSNETQTERSSHDGPAAETGAVFEAHPQEA